MRKTVLASAALAGGLLMTALIWSSAQATTSVPNPQSALGTRGRRRTCGSWRWSWWWWWWRWPWRI